MNHAQTLNDDLNLGTLGIGGAIGSGEALMTPTAPLEQRTETIAPMPTDVFTPLPGTRSTSRCCGQKTQPAPTVVNVNVNAGNNNGNNNGGARPGGATYMDTPSAFDQQAGTRIQRVEVPVEKIVEKPVYKPIVMVREIIRKIKEYVPMKQVYERQVGKPYDDQPLSFEGSGQRSTAKVAAAPTTTTTTAPTATTSTGAAMTLPAGILPDDNDNATISQTLPRP